MRQINDTALLVTVAEDLSNEPVLKVWALDTEKKDGGPGCLSTVSVQNARRQFPVCLASEAGIKWSILTYNGIDIGFRSRRRPLTGSSGFRERIGDDHPRRFNPRPRRATTDRIRIRGPYYRTRNPNRRCHNPLHFNNESHLDIGHRRARAGPACARFGRYGLWLGLHDSG